MTHNSRSTRITLLPQPVPLMEIYHTEAQSIEATYTNPRVPGLSLLQPGSRTETDAKNSHCLDGWVPQAFLDHGEGLFGLPEGQGQGLNALGGDGTVGPLPLHGLPLSGSACGRAVTDGVGS